MSRPQKRSFNRPQKQTGQRRKVSKKLAVIGKCAKKETGTTIHVWPDPVFFESPKVPERELARLLRPLTVGAAHLSWTQGQPRRGGVPLIATLAVNAEDAARLRTLLTPCLAAR